MAYGFLRVRETVYHAHRCAEARGGTMFQKIRRACLRPFLRVSLLCPVLCYSATAVAQNTPDVPTPSNYGGVGLLDMRTARFYPDGYLVLTTSFTQPDDRYAITFQALSWAELTFRYAIDRGYPGDVGVAVLHDRSFDAKFRLSHESEYVPEIALGLQDFIGTGVYSGEYLVGSKRWGPFDFTLGMGWGRLGSNGTFKNPFGILSKSFLTRSQANAYGLGGTLSLSNYFHGPEVGLFGGIEYSTPIENLKLKVEYSSDSYPIEKVHSGRDYSYPVNFGISYRPFNWLDIGLSLMHGRDIGLRVSTLSDPTAENWQARLDPPPRFRARADERANTILQQDASSGPPPIGAPETRFVDLTAQRDETGATPESKASGTAIASAPLASLPDIVVPGYAVRVSPIISAPPALDAATSERIRLGFEGQKLNLLGAAVEGDKIVIVIENVRYRRDTEAIARAARVLSALVSPEINYFEITLTRFGQPLTTVTFPRTEIDKLARREGSPAELFYASELSPGASSSLDHLQPDLFPALGGVIYPVFRQSLFDPDNPLYVMFGVGATEGLRLTRGWFVEGTVVASLYNDFNQIHRPPDSALPNVRSDIANYLKHETIGLENLSTSYFFKLAPEIYGRVSGGYLEQMFAGAGGELLYRPFGKRWAIGVDLWTVLQRGYDVLLDLRHYQAITGHLTAYYELPWHDVKLAVSAGQYLAGDKGVTFQLSRRFSTGVEVGAWFTLTNVSAAQFGEGSFDKGIRIVIPFEWVAPFATQSGYELALRPIQRDGGQRLNGDTILYGVTDPSSYGALTQEWNSVFK